MFLALELIIPLVVILLSIWLFLAILKFWRASVMIDMCSLIADTRAILKLSVEVVHESSSQHVEFEPILLYFVHITTLYILC